MNNEITSLALDPAATGWLAWVVLLLPVAAIAIVFLIVGVVVALSNDTDRANRALRLAQAILRTFSDLLRHRGGRR